ncbi:MAG: nucleoside deaminase [Azospirillaceae bacterium]
MPQDDALATEAARDARFMALALAEAEAAAARDEVPVGAVLVETATGRVLARAGNRTEADADPTAHAEMLAIRAAAAASGRPRLPGTTLYVTLEPCAMCATAVSFARIGRLVYGASDPKMGGVAHGATVFERPTCHHRPEVAAGEGADAAAALLRGFFRAKRTRPAG